MRRSKSFYDAYWRLSSKIQYRVKPLIQEYKPQLFISGHSHILKVMYDEKLQCLHMNPGAAGNQGWHKVRTIITFVIDGKNMKDCKVIELGSRIKALKISTPSRTNRLKTHQAPFWHEQSPCGNATG